MKDLKLLLNILTKALGGDEESAEQLMDDCYAGEYDSEDDYVNEYFEEQVREECYNFVRNFFDFEALHEQLFGNQCFSIQFDNKFHIFDREL